MNRSAPAIVDVHSHIYPRSYLEILKSRSEPPYVLEHDGAEYLFLFEGQAGRPPTAGLRLTPSFTDLDEKLRFMDSLGIAKSVVSVGNPWLDPFTANTGEMAKTINDELASYEGATGGRVVGMGVLPTQVRELASTINEIADTPHLYGVIVGCRIAGHELDAPELEQLWKAAAARRVAILVHPHYSAARTELGGYGFALPVALGNPFEVTIALSRLVLSGVLHRHPTLTLIASHGGGTLPYLAGRLDATWRSNADLRERLPHAPSEDLRKLFLDSIVFHERSLHAAVGLVGLSKVIYGTDHPFAVADPPSNIATLESTFSAEDLESIRSVNAGRALGVDI